MVAIPLPGDVISQLIQRENLSFFSLLQTELSPLVSTRNPI